MATPKSPTLTAPEPSITPPSRNGSDLEAQSQSPLETNHHARSPGKDSSFDIIGRRSRRSQTSKSYRPKLVGRQWKPGQEPGLDPASNHPAVVPTGLREDCQITVVDFSRDDIAVRELDNESLKPFLEEEKNSNLTCRWISVNGLSWDVISLLGRTKNFHRLALEDTVNKRNRTKADWYSDHTYMVFPLQKLVHMYEEPCDDDDDSGIVWLGEGTGDSAGKMKHTSHKRSIWHSMRQKLNPWPIQHYSSRPVHYSADSNEPMSKFSFNGGPPLSTPPDLYKRTLQRYNSGPNEERTEYMEFHSALRNKGLAVSVEQVSIFLCADNTVVSFFEYSADDVEVPIISRLGSLDTVIRRSNDASMVVQAILDAVIDLAIPVTAAYKDAIDELELNVLTEPAIEHTRSLYILISETSAFRSNVFPIANLVSSLRDHKEEPMELGAVKDTPNPTCVRISSLTATYLSDVEDHTILITEHCDRMRRAADNMISLIFNTINAYQSESMRQLTLVTILFLPLSFLTGYFGMNFVYFEGIQGSDAFYWQIASPLCFVVAIWLLRDTVKRWFVKTRQRRIIARRRKTRGDRNARQNPLGKPKTT